ncbi:STAS domain-containing protein [Tenggerimyces flavus]|uniref:Anti-sigma factor antagonist n=1 Tax=Tenggerimyces flavus TaxID=1708749 RepID=A0ABV7YJR0_9ACTN|nr:STAS domain-containing protein [Tenggerimyces flavus]MBM7787370.1 anti-anti-sigma factor [Tenggerimyces flavus]
MAVTIRAEPLGGRAVVIHLEGDVDIVTAREVRDWVFDLLDNSPGEVELIVVDLSESDFLDSSGLGALVAVYRRVHAQERSFCVASPAPMVARILEVSGLDQAWRVYPSAAEAIAALPPQEQN